MDFALIQLYRNILGDCDLMRDCSRVYYSLRKPAERSMEEYSRGLASIVALEAMDPFGSSHGALIDDLNNLNRDYNYDMYSEDGDASGYLILWDFYRSVMLEFMCDELSQFLFWAAKVQICTGAVSVAPPPGFVPLFRTFFATIIRNLRENGFLGSMRGSVPFLAAAFVHNFAHLDKLVRGYVSTIAGQPIPVSPSLFQSVSSDPMTKFLYETSIRATTTALGHPFLTVSVSQVCDPNVVPYPGIDGSGNVLMWAAGSTWVSTVCGIYGNSGWKGFFRGLRSSLSIAMLPVSPFLLLGIADMIMYRRMLGQSGSGVNDNICGSASRNHSASILYDILKKNDGYRVVTQYAQLTLYQFIPGLVAFMAGRAALWFVFGSTERRLTQRRRRENYLKSFWTNNPIEFDQS